MAAQSSNQLEKEVVKLTKEVKEMKSIVLQLLEHKTLSEEAGEWMPLIAFAEMKDLQTATIRKRFRDGIYPQKWWRKEGRLVFIFAKE